MVARRIPGSLGTFRRLTPDRVNRSGPGNGRESWGPNLFPAKTTRPSYHQGACPNQIGQTSALIGIEHGVDLLQCLKHGLAQSGGALDAQLAAFGGPSRVEGVAC